MASAYVHGTRTPNLYLTWLLSFLLLIALVITLTKHCRMAIHRRNFQPGLTEFRQPLQVQSHLEMPRILVQLGHIQRT